MKVDRGDASAGEAVPCGEDTDVFAFEERNHLIIFLIEDFVEIEIEIICRGDVLVTHPVVGVEALASS